MTAALPPGRLVAWYGDDFTGSAATMEVLAFAGLETVLFLDAPTPERLARFADARAIGIAGIARSQPPGWMDRHLPPLFRALAGLGAPVTHYKVCSTLDSAPTVGSIGRAIDLALPILGGRWHPLLVAAPPLGRWQVFGNLFARLGTETYRLDRHPVMSRHPVTPMTEADVARHVGAQTRHPIGLLDLHALRRNEAPPQDGRVVSLDVLDEDDLVRIGRLIWENRGDRLFAIGSQGVQYALVAYWRAAGLLPDRPAPPGAASDGPIVAVSGSVSPVTADQLAWAEANGFALIPCEAAGLVDGTGAAEQAVEAARRHLGENRSVVIHTARGPDDPAVGRFRSAIAGREPAGANEAVGRGLGRILRRLIVETGLRRAVISGGDTSGYGCLELGIYALTALWPTIPGAALSRAHAEDPALDGLELALKGGQMGSPDFFGWVRDGARPGP